MNRCAAVPLVAALLAGGAAAADDDAFSPRTIDGGHWEQGRTRGVYRIAMESVGFEHVSCRVDITWLAVPAAGRSPVVVAQVPFAEVSTGFWACGTQAEDAVLDGGRLTVRATHAYSGEVRTFAAVLGRPGEYRCGNCDGP